jgi:uncharacterized protein
MPVTPTFPGIYIEEIQSSAHTITAAPTSITVFVGYTHPFKTVQFNKPIELFSFTDYERWFGGFFRSTLYDSEADHFGDVAQAVNQFFLNGGSDAYVIGLQPQALKFVNPQTPNDPSIAAISIVNGAVTFTPRELIDSGHQMTITISNIKTTGSPPGSPPNFDDTADVTVTYSALDPNTKEPLGPGSVVETFRQVSLLPTDVFGKSNPNFIEARIGTTDSPISSLVTVLLDTNSSAVFQQIKDKQFPTTLPSNPTLFAAKDFTDVFNQDSELDKLSIFNLLVIPGVTDDASGSVLDTALAFCDLKRAFLVMDPPRDNSADGTDTNFPIKIEDTVEDQSTTGQTIAKDKNGSLYFPYLKSNDPLTGLANDPVTNQPFEIPPSGTVAGIFARTDLNRGVWKAPAGLETILNGVTGVVDRGRMTDQRQGILNPKGVNCLRSFPGIGTVVFGARTSVTENPAFEQWRYVPVRRMALFLEQTLYRSLGWVVFEPNDEPLWAAIRTSIEAFMLGLFRQGAFQGSKPSEAFQVKCDSQTTTQADIDNGIVNIVVAFAPLKPAEFVIIKISQLAGQTQTS